MRSYIRDCLHFFTGSIVFYIAFPIVYCTSLLSFAWTTYKLSKTSRRKRYANTDLIPQSNCNRPGKDMEKNLGDHLRDLEAEKGYKWRVTLDWHADKPPAYEPYDSIAIVDRNDANDLLLPSDTNKAQRFSTMSAFRMSPVLRYYFEEAATAV